MVRVFRTFAGGTGLVSWIANPSAPSRMRRVNVWRCSAALALVGIAAACGSSGTGPGGQTACSPPLSIGPTLFTENSGTIDVQYNATQTGDGTISSLTYIGPSGPVMVQNPSFPFSVSTTIPLPSQAQMSATGFFSNGTVTIAYSASVGGGDVESANQTCGGNNM
jgi:hypothetical protein